MLLSVRITPRSSYDRDMVAAERYRKYLEQKKVKESLPPLRYRNRTPGRFWDAADIADIMNLCDHGYSRDKIAKAYRVTRGKISGLVHKEKFRRLNGDGMAIAATAEAVQPDNANA